MCKSKRKLKELDFKAIPEKSGQQFKNAFRKERGWLVSKQDSTRRFEYGYNRQEKKLKIPLKRHHAYIFDEQKNTDILLLDTL